MSVAVEMAAERIGLGVAHHTVAGNDEHVKVVDNLEIASCEIHAHVNKHSKGIESERSTDKVRIDLSAGAAAELWTYYDTHMFFETLHRSRKGNKTGVHHSGVAARHSEHGGVAATPAHAVGGAEGEVGGGAVHIFGVVEIYRCRRQFGAYGVAYAVGYRIQTRCGCKISGARSLRTHKLGCGVLRAGIGGGAPQIGDVAHLLVPSVGVAHGAGRAFAGNGGYVGAAGYNIVYVEVVCNRVYSPTNDTAHAAAGALDKAAVEIVTHIRGIDHIACNTAHITLCCGACGGDVAAVAAVLHIVVAHVTHYTTHVCAVGIHSTGVDTCVDMAVAACGITHNTAGVLRTCNIASVYAT